MKIIVQRSRRFGLNSGCWWISRAQAKKLCDGQLPGIGHERVVKRGLVPLYLARGGCINANAVAYVANIAGSFRLHDSSSILNITER